MNVTVGNPPGTTPPAGPYSQVARIDHGSGALLILSGQIAVDDEGNLVGEGDMGAQAERIFHIIEELLGAHGATFADVVNIRTFLTDLTLLPQYGAVRRPLFPTPPTSTTVEVSRLFRPGALLEVEVVAAVQAT